MSSTQQQPWFTFPITKTQQTGDAGVDLGVPFHTPITALLSGTVTNISTGGWGQELDIAGLNGTTESYVHFDQIASNIHIGSQISVGQLLGWSGGQLSGGTHNATSQYSTGPHVEFDIFKGTPWQSGTINPLPVIQGLQQLAQNGGQGLQGIWQALTNGAATNAANLPQGIWQALFGGAASNAANLAGGTGASDLGSAIGVGIASGAGSIGGSLLSAFGVSSLKDLAFRWMLIWVGAVVLLIVFLALLFGGNRGGNTTEVITSAAKAAAA